MAKANDIQLGQKRVFPNTMDFVVSDYVTGDVLFRVDYAQDVELSVEYDKTEIRGGATDRLHYSSHHTPEATFSANLPLNDNNVIAVKTGARVKDGKQISAYDNIFTVDREKGTLKLPFLPEAGTLKIYNTNTASDTLAEIKVGEPSSVEDAYSISGKTVTFNDVKKGKLVFVKFDYMTEENAESMAIIAGKLPSLITIDLKTMVTDTDGNIGVQMIRVPKAKASPDLSFQTSAGDPAVMPFECDVFTEINEDGDPEFFKFMYDSQVPAFGSIGI